MKNNKRMSILILCVALISALCWPTLRDAFLVQSVVRRDIAGTDLLLRIGADPNTTRFMPGQAMVEAASAGDDKIVRLLLTGGGNPNAIVSDSWSALIAAIEKRHPSTVKILLDWGANPNMKNGSGRTPLRFSIDNHDDQTALLLKQHGARMD